MIYNPADSKEPVSVASSHYRDQLLREAERMYKRKTGVDLEICRTTLNVEQGRKEDEYFLETKVRCGDRAIHVAYYVDPTRSLERNAWGLGEIVARKYKHNKVLY